MSKQVLAITLAGPSGCGKSTLARAITRLVLDAGIDCAYDFDGTKLPPEPIDKREWMRHHGDNCGIWPLPFTQVVIKQEKATA